MSNSKYVDLSAIIQVIGNVFNNPSLLELEDKYIITDDDFQDDFHKIIFGSIYKIYHLGAKKITLENIYDFLTTRPRSEAIFKQQKGEEWLIKASESAQQDSFDYYYQRLKKFSLLRAYDKCGINVSHIYDPANILDFKKKQSQEEWLDNSSLEQIALKIDGMIEDIKIKYVDHNYKDASQAGSNIFELIESLKSTPEVGIPLYGRFVNTVSRGARLGKLYLRSGATGTGKTRALIADACNFACDTLFDLESNEWLTNNTQEPTLFIATEQDLSEVQTMMLSFISGVNEEHILNGKYEGNEEERVIRAATILNDSPLYVEILPDFSLQDIENTIKKNMREHGVKYVAYDYIHTSMKILEEITKRSGGIKLREDNILFMMSTKLKDLCVQYNIFIITSTQLNSDYLDSEEPDQNLLRGAKSIADRIDLGMIMLSVTKKDTDSLATIISTKCLDNPTIKISVYKNRRGRWKGIYLWCKGDLGTCRIEPLFATNYRYEYIDMKDTYIHVEEGDGAIF